MKRYRKPAWTLDEHRRFAADLRRLRDLIGAALADLGGRGGVRAEHIDVLLKVHHGIERARLKLDLLARATSRVDTWGIYFGSEKRR